MAKFALQYIGVMCVVMFAISLFGYGLGESLQSWLPDDGIDLYPSYEAAVAAANRGHEIAGWIENALVTASALIIFVVMHRRYKARNRES